MCDEWKNDFVKFRDWSLSNGYNEKFELDKDILCDKLEIYPKIYSPKTCTWVSKSKNRKYINSNFGKEKLIEQYDLNNNFINSYHTIAEASRATGISTSSISTVCTGKKEKTKGFKWKKK